MAFANEPTDDSLESSLPFAAPTPLADDEAGAEWRPNAHQILSQARQVGICVFASADACMRRSKQLFSTADAFRSPNADCLGCCANIDSFQHEGLDNAAATGFCPMQIAMEDNGKPTPYNP
ncbi:hypothetical protein CFIO01_10571 [Colletotrichum fioriniae PJ7]|uniref:Uncharacterized protein n=1 Tax=Colletotrichum fioriniae PJ7 TaxID=1445577 RepID=A0A010Q042_9PEZI|nr:hypothetical protein CFIO01_10571 [Colletotrichum fioriniae PJ7]